MAFERKQFTFYRSFLAIAEQLPANKQRDFLMSLVNYALNEIEPTTKDKTVKAAFEGIRPVLDKARTKAQQGKIGGSAERKTEANTKRTEANTKRTEANTKRTEANGSEREAEKEGEKEKEKEKEIEIEVEGEKEKNCAFASPTRESDDIFSEVFDTLHRREVFMAAKDEAECKALCTEYGTRAIIQAIERAYDQHAPRWSYVRAIVTSGGVGGRKKDKGGYQRHGDDPSPGMIAAARAMLEEDDL